MKRLSILTCYILFTWLGNCDIVIMDKYLLKVNHMVQKHRFVFAECEKKDAYIEMEMELKKQNTENAAKFFIIILNEKEEFDEFSKDKEESDVGCCVDSNNYCGNAAEQTISLNLSPFTEPDFKYYKEIDLGVNTTAEHVDKLDVIESGVYYTFFAFCGDERAGNEGRRELFTNVDKENDIHLEMSGRLVYKNPYGYLNAEQYPLLNYFLTLLIIYSLALVLWMLFVYKYKEHIIRIHHFITFVLVVSTLEFLFSYIQVHNYNTNGRRNILILILYVILNVMKNTSARVLTLLVSLGYGISRPSVAKYHGKISSLAFLYILANLMYLSIAYLNLYKPVSKGVLLFVTVPSAVLNAIFFYWIFTALMATRRDLDSKNQHIKLKMIKKLIMALGISIGICLGLGIAEVYFKLMMDRDEYWGTVWVFEGLWAFVFTVILFTILFIMKPSERSRLMAYGEELVDESHTHEADGEQIEMPESDAREVRKDAGYMYKADQQYKDMEMDMEMDIREEKKYQ